MEEVYHWRSFLKTVKLFKWYAWIVGDMRGLVLFEIKKKGVFPMHKIKSGERKTPHVEGLLFAIKKL